MTYRPPVESMADLLLETAGLQGLLETGNFPDVTPDLVTAVMEEGAKLAADILAPLNRPGDLEGARLADGGVTTPQGFAEAYAKWVEGGWGSISANPQFGGQGMPLAVGAAMQEMWNAACMSFGLCPILSQGAIEALSAHGTDEQKALYLAKLISGEWTGTMNLTEPQAGSDLAALRTRAERQPDGTYRISGTKIFITYGDHDFADNIVHLVLARLPDAPPGTKGISLFLVPKFLVNPDGSLGARNDVVCTRLEEKIGIHGSPTCVMNYGEKEGAIGYLIGQENRGLACMFTMMNNARLLVGIQGVAIAERAYQHALAYAKERRQGRPFGVRHDATEMVPIIQHPDVRRMLFTMKALADASRAICYATAVATDTAHYASDEAARAAGKARSDLLTPIAKAWSTDVGVEVASIGVQVHGGMGFVEETGAGQYYRDARILPIYEGTNGIQAIDLVTRKLPLANGDIVRALLGDVETNAQACRDSSNAELQEIGAGCLSALEAARRATDWLLANLADHPNDSLAGANAYLELMGLLLGGHFLACRARAAAGRNETAAKRNVTLALFYSQNLLPKVTGLAASIGTTGETLYRLDADQMA